MVDSTLVTPTAPWCLQNSGRMKPIRDVSPGVSLRSSRGYRMRSTPIVRARSTVERVHEAIGVDDIPWSDEEQRDGVRLSSSGFVGWKKMGLWDGRKWVCGMEENLLPPFPFTGSSCPHRYRSTKTLRWWQRRPDRPKHPVLRSPRRNTDWVGDGRTREKKWPIFST